MPKAFIEINTVKIVSKSTEFSKVVEYKYLKTTRVLADMQRGMVGVDAKMLNTGVWKREHASITKNTK